MILEEDSLVTSRSREATKTRPNLGHRTRDPHCPKLKTNQKDSIEIRSQ